MKKMKERMEHPSRSLVKKARTKGTAHTILPPNSLRSLLDTRKEFLADILGTLSRTPKHVKAASDKTVPPPTSSKPRHARKALITNLDLRRSPRKHIPARPPKKVNQLQARTSENIEPQPKNKNASQTTVHFEQDHELDSDVDGHGLTRVNDTSTYQLVDEENSSDESDVPPQGRFNSKIEQEKQSNNHRNVQLISHKDKGQEKDGEALSDDEEEESSEDEGHEEDGDEDNSDDEEHVQNGNDDVDAPATAVEVPKIRKSRGKTRCINLVGIAYNARPRVILISLNQLIGPLPIVKSSASSIGILASNPEVVSLANKTWKEVPKIVKKDIRKQLRNTWIIPKEGKNWVMKTAAASFRTNKCRLKANYFNEYMSYDQLVKNRPESVPKDQWNALLAYWLDNKTMERAIKNCQSAALRKNMHTTGSKTFARIIASEFVDGPEPSLAQVYIRTRTKSGGALAMDEKTKEELNKIKHDDARVEEYLSANKFIKKRNGSVSLKGRGVTPSELKKRRYEEEVKKKAENSIQLIQEDCNVRIKMVEGKFTRAIQNIVAMFQSPNQHVDFSTF